MICIGKTKCTSRKGLLTVHSWHAITTPSSASLHFAKRFGMISVQVPTSLCMQNKIIIHSRDCFVEQYVYPREPNIYMGNLYLRDE